MIILPSDFAPYINIDKGLSRMKYVKAQAVFPESLLEEIQKYIQGELVYIPKSPGSHKKWGANTGARIAIAHRNESIVQAFKAGTSIPQLAVLYCLAEDTIKKIVYGKR